MNFCSKCGRKLEVEDPLLEIEGRRYCQECYQVAKKLEIRHVKERIDMMTDEELKRIVLDVERRLHAFEQMAEWDKPGTEAFTKILKLSIDQNRAIMAQNELMLRELRKLTASLVKR